jgi:hypothetical protein
MEPIINFSELKEFLIKGGCIVLSEESGFECYCGGDYTNNIINDVNRTMFLSPDTKIMCVNHKHNKIVAINIGYEGFNLDSKQFMEVYNMDKRVKNEKEKEAQLAKEKESENQKKELLENIKSKV